MWVKSIYFRRKTRQKLSYRAPSGNNFRKLFSVVVKVKSPLLGVRWRESTLRKSWGAQVGEWRIPDLTVWQLAGTHPFGDLGHCQMLSNSYSLKAQNFLQPLSQWCLLEAASLLRRVKKAVKWPSAWCEVCAPNQAPGMWLLHAACKIPHVWIPRQPSSSWNC